MSVNSTVGQKYLVEVEALKDLLSSFIVERNAAQTVEDKALVEAKAVVLFEQLLELDYKLQNVSPGDYPDYESYQEFYNYYLYSTKVALAKLRKLADMFITYFNSEQYTLTDLLGKLKRVRQKKAALSLWSGDKAKFVLSESFLNLDNLNTQYSSAAACHVQSSEGVLTLPVRDRAIVPISSISIGSSSNGLVGNSDEEVTTNNISPDYIINGDANNWFEYERLDSGPLNLVLILEFPKAEIVNHIAIAPFNIGQAYSYVVDDITFSANGNVSSLADVVGEIDRDRLVVKSAGNDSEWNLTFVPTYAKTIAVKLKQAYSYPVKVASSNGAPTRRNRFAIGIQSLRVNRLRYASEGGINSTERTIRQGLYVTAPVANVWPPKDDLFDALLEVSFDGGESWISAENVDDGEGGSVLMDGTESSMIWRLNVSRDDASFSNATTFVPVSGGIKEIDTFLRPVNRFASPAVLALPGKPARKEIFVMQPRIARRGNRFKKIPVGIGTGTANSIELPFSIVDQGLDPEQITVYVNSVEYTYNFDDVALAAGEWAFSNDFSELLFTSDLPEDAKVSLVLEEERMLFEERADGYYHQMEMLFDPEQDNIDISYNPRASAQVSMLLPRDKKVIKLGYSNIELESLTLTGNNGTVYYWVGTRAGVNAGPNYYYLDTVNGILWLSAEFDNETVRATFRHQTPQELPQDDFDVVYDNETVRPWGLRVASNAFQATEATDTVGAGLQKRINPITGKHEARTPKVATATDAMTLSYDYIVKGTVRVDSTLLENSTSPEEVEFVDGKSEFLGLIPMDKESTVSIQAGGTGIVEFNLAAGALWYERFSVMFDDTSVFVSEKTALVNIAVQGDYFVSSDGVVSVHVGVAGKLPAGIAYQYYYQDPDFNPRNKFSVDYRNGVLYTGSPLQSGGKVSYKASSHKVSYNVARQVKRYDYNSNTNSVRVRTENLKPVNNLVKVIWAKETKTSSLQPLTSYFSPIISNLSFRYN